MALDRSSFDSGWALIDQLPVEFFIKDRSLRIIYANKARAEALGLADLSEALGRTDFDFFPQSMAQKWMEEEQRIISGVSEPIDQVTRESRLTKEGPGRLVFTSKSALYDQEGQILGILGIAKPVASIGNQIEHMYLAVNLTAESLWHWDLRNRKAWFSPGWKHMLGYTDQELPNDRETFWSRVHTEDTEHLRQAFQDHTKARTPTFQCRYRIQHRAGHWLWIASRGTAVFDDAGQPIEFAGIDHNITDEYMPERSEGERFRKAEDYLAYEAWLGSLFAAYLHDCTHRLSSLAMNLSTVRDVLHGDSKHKRDSLETLVKRMTDDIEVLSDMSKAYRRTLRGKGVIQKVDLRETIQTVLDGFNPVFTRERIRVETRIPSEIPLLHLSPSELHAVLMNLLSNACKSLAPAKGKLKQIRVCVQFTRPVLTIEITDNGAGVAPENRDRIFAPGFSTTGGTGLGLFICKDIVTAWGGHIECHSSWGDHATFSFTIPFENE